MSELLSATRALMTHAHDRIVAERDQDAIRAGDWFQRVAAWRDLLAETPGPAVALYFDDSIEFAAALWGAWLADKTAVLPGNLQAEMRDQVAAAGLVMYGDCEGTISLLLPIDANSGDLVIGPMLLAGEKAAVVIYTSGSTGEPLAIPKRLQQLEDEIRLLELHFADALGSAARMAATVSHQHIYGLLFKVLWPLMSWRPMHVESLSFAAQIETALRSGRTALIASPAHIKRLCHEPALGQVVPLLTFSSGGPLDAAAAIVWRMRFGAAPIEVYGSSETGGVAIRQRSEIDDENWQVMADVAMRVNAETQQIALSSPRLDQPGWSAVADRADVVAADQHGVRTFRLLGRLDRIVKLEEKRISLDALERGLQQHPYVDEARVMLIAGDRDLLGAVLRLSNAGWTALGHQGRRKFSDVLRQALSSAFEPSSQPRRWRYVQSLPQDAQGKVTLALLLALFAPRRPAVHWLQQGPSHCEGSLYIDPQLRVFDGHFPVRPVLAGVAQLQWVIEFAREAFALSDRIDALEQIKFQHIIEAGATVDLVMDYDRPRGRLEFKVQSERGPHSRGRLVFRTAGA